MKKIATHNSATGEKPGNFISWLGTIFARCQRKTVKEQYEAGCRLFDFRIRQHRGIWYCYHGFWRTKRTFLSIFEELEFKARKDNEVIFISLTYEDKLNNPSTLKQFADFANGLMACYNAKFINFYKKYPWEIIVKGNGSPKEDYEKKFKELNFSSWHSLIPIPILWKQFFFKNVKFREDIYYCVDFL